MATFAIILIAVIGGTGLRGVQQLHSAIDKIVNGTVILENHMTADMMHDALKADVLAAIIAAGNANTTELQNITNDLNEHALTFKNSLYANKKLIHNAEIATALNKTLPVLQDYISSASNMIWLAGSDLQSATNQLPQFKQAFDILAIEMESLTELISKNTSNMQKAGADTVELSENIIFLVIVVAITLLCISSWLISANISQSLTKLITIANRIAGGDLTLQTLATSNDEIGQLTQAMDKMREHLLDLISKISFTTDQLSSTADEIAAVTLQTSTSIKQQQQETELVASAMNEMTVTVQSVANNIANTARAADMANTETTSGSQVVGQTVEQIQELSSQIGNTANVVNQLESNSIQISKVLDVIKSIAEQTNLLALNAAIEAARAGEQGRGFAVVADEVRTLASRTQESTEEINKMISQLQSGSKMAVVAMNQSLEQTELAVNQANIAGETLRSISDSVAQINNMSTEIASAAVQQGVVAEDINNNLSHINNMSIQAAEGAAQASAVTTKLTSMASELQAIVIQFKI